MYLSRLIFLISLPTYLCMDLTYTVEEQKGLDTYIGDIAEDSNVMDSVASEDQKLIRFSQLQQDATEETQLFRVSQETGKLYTADILDAEVMCEYKKECFKLLDVAVRKGASSIKILEIKIIIQDINDHQPEFPVKQATIAFEENNVPGTKITIPNAVDQDVRVIHSEISYELQKPIDVPFSLVVSPKIDGTSKLEIMLEGRLDREVKDSYLIQVVAKDGGFPPKQSTLHVIISVTDVNDNAPLFSQKVYKVSIKNEPSETLPILILSAKDLDLGENGKVGYDFSSQTSEIAKAHFQLNRINGEIFLHHKFTSSQEREYRLFVEATDKGASPLSSTALVLINVINQKNNAPHIKVTFVSTSENTIRISENIKVGSFIAYVKVTDDDDGQNGEVSCELQHDRFQIQNLGTKKYEVTIRNPFDRETEDHHDIIIRCWDKGSPPLYNEKKFSIQVMDINDVEPQFTKDTFKFLIDENEKSRITVGYINATDPDLGAGGKLTYSLITNNKHFLPFRISPNGLLSAIMSLDHEFQDTYEFQVFVKDNGTPSLNNTVNVIVEVTDKNDNAPYFTFPSVKPHNMDVTYYPHHTKNITQIKASDSDSQENAFLKYEIIRGNSKQIFSINQYTGLLSSTHALSQQDAGSYELEFLVKDSGSPVLSATTTLFLTLTIINKTSQMLNVIELESEEKVHLNLVIIIIVIAVIISVFITASLTTCIFRCYHQSNVAHAQACGPSNRYAQPLPTDQTLSRSTSLKASRRLHLSGPDHHFPELPSQMCTLDTSISPRYFTWISATSSQGENKHHPESADLLSSKFSSEPIHPPKKDISGSFPQSRNPLEINKPPNSVTRPLPPIPNIEH